ncbi:addiction module antidote protein [Reyranella sp.]|uniref:addiction module antidote protein n=1 Tax=Reyranella sp. TaxID=1929291 RepID=UPI003D0FDA67
MKVTYAPFDAADYLDNDAVIAEYLTAAAEDPNPEVFLLALSDVARAKGIAKIAKSAGLGRESLYKALSAGAHPRYETVSAVLRALGVKLSMAIEPRRPARRKSPAARAVVGRPKKRTASARG